MEQGDWHLPVRASSILGDSSTVSKPVLLAAEMLNAGLV